MILALKIVAVWVVCAAAAVAVLRGVIRHNDRSGWYGGGHDEDGDR